MGERREGGPLLPLILLPGLLFLAQGLLWAMITPLFQVPDEVQHFAVVRFLAEEGRWPVQGEPIPASVAAAKDLADFLPLALGNPVPPRPPGETVRALPTLEELRSRTSPAREPVYTAYHPPLYYLILAPISRLLDGVGMGLHLVALRTVSVLLALPAAPLAALTVRELAPGRRGWQLGAGLLVAAHPYFAQMSAGVNNDALVYSLGAAYLYLAARAARRGLGTGEVASLGAVSAAGLLAKLTFLPFVLTLPLVVLAAGGRRWRLILLFALPPALWYGVALRAGLRGVLGSAGPRRAPALVDLARFVRGWGWGPFHRSFWGLFAHAGTTLVLIPYWVLDAIALLGLLGFLARLLRERPPWRQVVAGPLLWLLCFFGIFLAVVLAAFRFYLATGEMRGYSGRYLFPALPGVAAAVAGGLTYLAGALRRRWLRRILPLALPLYSLSGLASVALTFYGPLSSTGVVGLFARMAWWNGFPPFVLLFAPLLALLLLAAWAGALAAVELVARGG